MSYDYLCDHGRTKTQHCAECHVNDDPSWRTTPLTEIERAFIYELLSQDRTLLRPSPYTVRNMTFDGRYEPLCRMLIREHEMLRAEVEELRAVVEGRS